MKKIFLFLIVVCLSLFASAQVEEQEYYLYNIVTFSGKLKNEGLKVNIDNGKEIKKLQDKDGRVIKFKTPAAVLMYLTSEGWELYRNGATIDGSEFNINSEYITTTYWIVRKPCTKDELAINIEDGISR